MNELIKAALNAFAVFACCIFKVPQIIKNWKARSTEGLSLASLILESTSYTITFSYFIFNGYPLADFFDYPMLLIQSITLICLHFYFKHPRMTTIAKLASGLVAYGFFVRLLSSPSVVSEGFIKLLLKSALPISPVSKILQIWKIIQTKRGDLLSTVPGILSALSSSARIITVFSETGDPILLLNFSMSVILNIVLVITINIYSNPPDDIKKKN